MNETRKWLVVGFMIILCIIMLILTLGTGKRFFLDRPEYSSTNLAIVDKDTPVSLSDYSDDMPKAGSHTYGIREYEILNNIVVEGSIINEYKMTFKNMKRKDYDIDSAYNDFDHDFAEYAEHLRGYIIDLQSMSPATSEAQFEQKNMLDKVNKLYVSIKDYPNHNTYLNDTLKYLDECSYNLSRVSAQMKLPVQ